jgi:starch-binding outer membrane protein, SusD/RagB family
MRTIAKRWVRERGGSRLRALIVAFFIGVVCGACEGLLDVESPTRVGAETLEDPAVAQTLVNSAIGEFECAFAQFVAATGELTDELRHSSAWLAMTVWDHRQIDQDRDVALCNLAIGHSVYTPLQKARFSAEDAKRRLEGWTDAQVPERMLKIATVAAYAGYARTLLGEAFCEMAIDLGPLVTPTEVLQSAEQRFTEAITAARTASSSEFENMAMVGRARVRLDLGDKAGARADAQAIPQGFKKTTTHSSADQYRYNRIYQHNYVDAFISVSNEFLNLQFGGVPDPRVRVVPAPIKGHDLSDIHWQTKYTSLGSPITIASWEEAQLIIAEVDLGQSAVDVINTLHAAVGLPPYVPNNVNDNAEILGQVIQERSRQLYLEGHRLNDFLRHNLPFATGQSPYDGVTYGATTCLPLPRAERSGNPNLPEG